MVDKASLHSIQLERAALSGLLKFPDVLSEVDAFVKTETFNDLDSVHSTIYSSIKILYEKNEYKILNSVILADFIKNLGLSSKGEINIFDYIENLFHSGVTKDATLESFKELVKYRIRRELDQTAREIAKFVRGAGEKTVNEIISNCDKIYGDRVNTYTLDDCEPEDLYKGTVELVEAKGNSPDEETGLITPYQEFNNKFGGIRTGNGVYCIISRPKMGKSSWLLNMADGISSLNEGCKTLILDTEMTTNVARLRLASKFSSISTWFLETGQFRKNAELTAKFRNIAPELNKRIGTVYHLKVANKPINEVISLTKRFYYKYIGRGSKFLLIYDYLKTTSEVVSQNWAEHQIIGDKINRFNDLGSELECPIWLAMQQNRTAESGIDDSSTAALSDRIQWFCAFNAIFRRKTLEELAEYGQEYGSHLLKPLATRFQGKEASGHNDWVKVSAGKTRAKYLPNFINYDLNNFLITEHHDLQYIINQRQISVNITQNNPSITSALD